VQRIFVTYIESHVIDTTYFVRAINARSARCATLLQPLTE
jgi:hypothetical protein